MPYAKGDGPSVVIALGGNALGSTPAEQRDRVAAEGNDDSGHGVTCAAVRAAAA